MKNAISLIRLISSFEAENSERGILGKHSISLTEFD